MAMDYDYEYNNSTYHDHQEYYYLDDHDGDDFSSSMGSNIHRFLAPAGGAPVVDYSVISIIVMTLGIVLAVEVLRHQLDVAASGNPFFHTVLELMYRELTTLGIVEFCIYLMHKYHKNFNFKMEAMFVDVHFMLFYTAVFNALQSSLVRLLTTQLTDRVWLRTEDMDIRHYVALRREYDRLEKTKALSNNNYYTSSSNPELSSRSASDSEHGHDSESATSAWKSFRQALHDLAFQLRHPILSRRMSQLTLPIRFHALRSHFIDSYDLPPKFKVSHYLKRSLTSVLLDFVHISSAAWIMLMVTANLLWFLSGVLLYVTEDSLEVEEFLVYIFVSMMVVFVVFAFVLFFKMKSIFSNIMNMKLTIDSENESKKTWGDGARVSRVSTNRNFDQLKLFWGDNPHLIIVATQYMQFGYALGLAMIFTYFRDFQKNHSIASPGQLLAALLASYLIFLKLVSDILPQYTLCTSIGQLANKERLNETLAKLQLTEEIRKKATLEEVRKAEEEIARRKKEIEEKNAEAAERVNKTLKLPTLSFKDPKYAYNEDPRPEQKSAGPRARSLFRHASAAAGLSVNLDHDSPERKRRSTDVMGLFHNKNGDSLEQGLGGSWLRHNRKKSLSDGTKLMSVSVLDGPSTSLNTSSLEQRKESVGATNTSEDRGGDGLGEEQRKKPPRSRRLRSLSDGVKFISNLDVQHEDLLHSGPSSTTQRLSPAAAEQLQVVDEDAPQIDEMIFKTNENSSSPYPSFQPMHSGREILSAKSMNSTDRFAIGDSLVKPFSAPKEAGTGTQTDINLSLNMVGTENVSDTERPMRRSNPLEATMMSHSEEKDVANGKRSGSPKLLAEHTELPSPNSIYPTVDRIALGHSSEKHISAPKEDGAETHGHFDQSLNMVGSDEVSEIERLMSRPSPPEATMVPHIDAADGVHGELSGSSKFLVKPLVATKDDGIETQHHFDQSWDMEDTDDVPEIEHFMSRPSPPDDEMMPHIGDIDATDGGNCKLSLSSKFLEKPIPTIKDDGIETQHHFDQSLNMVGTNDVSEIERLMSRPSPPEVEMMPHIDVTDAENGELSGSSKFSTDHTEVPSTSTDPTAHGPSSEKPLSAPKEDDTDKPGQFDQLLNMVGTDDISEMERLKRRSNSSEIAKMRYIDETGVVNGEGSGPSRPFADHTNSSEKDERKERRRRLKAQSDGVSFMRSSLKEPEPEWLFLDSLKEIEPEKLATLSELAHIPTEDSTEISDFTPEDNPKRRLRTRAVSAGVSWMRAGPTGNISPIDDTSISNTTEGPKDSIPMQDFKFAPKMRHIDETDVVHGGRAGLSNVITNHIEPSLGRNKQRHRPLKTQSDGVSFMAIKEREPEKLATLSEQSSTKDFSKVPDFPQKVKPKRRPRTRSVSAGVASMSAVPTMSKMSLDDTAVKSGSTMRLLDGVVNGRDSGPPLSKSAHTNERKQRRRLVKTRSEGVSTMRSTLQFVPSLESSKEGGPEKLATLSELAQLSTADLPDLTDPDFSIKIKRTRRTRTRAASAGVSSMRALPIDSKSSVAAIKVSLDDSSMTNSGNCPKVIPQKQEPGSVTPVEPAKNRVTFALGTTHNISGPETSLDIKNGASFDSTASEDGDSDFDDMTAFTPNAGTPTSLQAIKQKFDLAAFFEGSQYRIISLIFGPMACFFFVAMRVEIFNIFAGTFVDQTGIWREMLAPCFWVQVSLYCLMIIEMVSVLLVFLSKRNRKGTTSSCCAAILGILINVMCLSLLLISETKRCCPDNDNVFIRLLAGSAPSAGYDDPADEYIECCPAFGERKYGGLGKIEPFTCLIALSPLRFLLAGYVVKLFGKGASHDEDEGAEDETHGHHHGPDPTVKVRDLWMTAIGVHSEIATLFGPFSGELLQCMLGIYSSETSHFATSSSLPSVSQSSLGDPGSSDADNENTDHECSTHHERRNSMDIVSNTSSRGIMSPPMSPSMARHQYFEHPEALLIRRMRRCEMRLLPLLNDVWMTVDVVITNHELIIFDVVDETEVYQTTPDNVIPAKNVRGGKTLPLSVVSEGRAIMDQFDLNDVDFVDIEHRAAIRGDINDEDIESRNNLLEYWEGGNHSNGDYDADAMSKRWGRVNEDRLKIRFADKQTLYLRFMVDLKEMELKRKSLADDPDLMHHVGTMTKLWCRSIAKLRGKANLKQDLPHFGNRSQSGRSTDGMEDFIEICERGSESGNNNAKKIAKTLHKRMSSFNLAGMDN